MENVKRYMNNKKEKNPLGVESNIIIIIIIIIIILIKESNIKLVAQIT